MSGVTRARSRARTHTHTHTCIYFFVYISRQGQQFFSSQGTHETSYSVVTKNLFPGVMRPGHEVNHSTPSSTGIKNESSYALFPLSAYIIGHGQLKTYTYTHTKYVLIYIYIYIYIYGVSGSAVG